MYAYIIFVCSAKSDEYEHCIAHTQSPVLEWTRRSRSVGGFPRYEVLFRLGRLQVFEVVLGSGSMSNRSILDD